MAYAPTTNNNSGQILAQGITAGADNIKTALDGIMKKREEAKSAIATMDMLASLNPEALPKDAAGNVDAAFLEKFYAAPLNSQQQTIGLITSKLLQTPEDKARVGLQNAQTGLINEQAGQYKAAALQAAQGAQAYQGHKNTLNKWSRLVNPSAAPATPFTGPELPMPGAGEEGDIGLPPLPEL